MAWHEALSKKYQTRKGHKYKAQAVSIAGDDYRSKLESEVHGMLKLLERAGKIKNIRREQTIQITPSIKHKLDFVVFDIERGVDIGIEAKGFEDSRWTTVAQAYKDFAPMPIQVWKKDKGRVFMFKEIAVGKYEVKEK